MNGRRPIRRTLAVLTLTLAAVPGFGAVPGLDPDAAYAATRIIEAGGERLTQQYHQQSALVSRMETRVDGQDSVMIMRGDRNLMWTVVPAQRMYMEISLDRAPPELADLPDPEAWTSVQRVGRESVHGVPATVYQVRGGDGRETAEGRLWVSDDGIAVRMEFEGDDGPMRMELRDLRPGPQPAVLFEPPGGYQRLAVGGVGGVGGVGSDAAPGMVDGVVEEAAQEVKDTAGREARRQIRENVGRGLRNLLGRP